MPFAHFPSSLLFLLPLALLGALSASLVTSPFWRLAILVCFAGVVVAQWVSIYFSGGVIDYQFFVNLNLRDIVSGLRVFKVQAALSLGVFVGGVLLLFWFSQSLDRVMPILLRAVTMMVCVVSLCHPKGPVIKLAEIYQITQVKAVPFETTLAHFSMLPYVTQSTLRAAPGKNIIVLSLESFERGFLEDVRLTPNMNALTHRYTYYPNMPMGLGSSWTTASLYTYMTGVPFLMGNFSTSPLENVQQTQLVSLGHVLGRAGYQMRYVLSQPEFADIGKMIQLFGIPVVSEHDYPGMYPNAPFGLYDRDIFDIAKKQVRQLRAQGTPFALFVSTISTHAPNGFKDNRMQTCLGHFQDDMTFAAASLDYSVGDFIRFLEQEGVLHNTIFYMFPDHLMMGAGTPTIARLSEKKRSLYLLTNASATALAMAPTQRVYQIDLPRVILKGAGVQTNALFLTDRLHPTTNTLLFIEQHKQALAQLNKAASLSASH